MIFLKLFQLAILSPSLHDCICITGERDNEEDC